MNKTIWMILIFGVGTMAALGYLSTKVIQTNPRLRRFFLIRNTLAQENGIPEKTIRMHRQNDRVVGVLIHLKNLATLDALTLEGLAGQVFDLEAQAMKGKDGGTISFFREVVFEGVEGMERRINRNSFKRRRDVRLSISPEGRVCRELATLFEVDPGSLDIAFVEDEPLSSRVGVTLHHPEEGEGEELPKRAPQAGGIVFGQLFGKIQFFEIIQKRGGSERRFTANAKSYSKERTRARGPAGIRWEKVFESQ